MIRFVNHPRLEIKAQTYLVPEAMMRERLVYTCEVNNTMYFVGPFWLLSDTTTEEFNEADAMAIRAFENKEKWYEHPSVDRSLDAWNPRSNRRDLCGVPSGE